MSMQNDIFQPKKEMQNFWFRTKHFIQRKWLQFVRKYWYGPNWRTNYRDKRPVTAGGEELYQAVKAAGEYRRARIRLEHLGRNNHE